MQTIFILIWAITSSATVVRDKLDKQTKQQQALMNIIKIVVPRSTVIAIDKLKMLIRSDTNFVDPYYTLAMLYSNNRYYEEAKACFEKAFAKDIQGNRKGYYLMNYARSLAGSGDFNGALQAIDSFLALPHGNNSDIINTANQNRKSYLFAVEYAKKYPNTVFQTKPRNLGTHINTAVSEYYPSIPMIDSQTFYFTRRTGIDQEDVFTSKFKDSIFSLAVQLASPINLYPKKGAINISQDGKHLLFAANIPGQGYGGFDIYECLLTDSGWSTPQNLGPYVNTASWESSPSISPDNNTLYFSSQRPGGFGGEDIYVSQLKDGVWGPAKNMGGKINTGGNEWAPFLHPDNNTLYFTSDGLPGYGSADIFVTKRDSTGNWTTPINLGYPINTIDHEGSFFATSQGDQAYFTTDRIPSQGLLDLFQVQLFQTMITSPEQAIYIKGRVIDSISRKGLPAANIDVFNNHKLTDALSIESDSAGYFFLTLPINESYILNIASKNYLFKTDSINLTENQNRALTNKKYIYEFAMLPLVLNAKVIIHNVLFETNAYKIIDSLSINELNNLYRLLTNNPSLKVEIDGFTDNVGTPEFNLELSKKRAESVVQYLIKEGIAPDRLFFRGFGEGNPIGDNNTEDGRNLNRRTEIKIIAL